jgi:hypothetical protein
VVDFKESDLDGYITMNAEMVAGAQEGAK